MSKKSDKKESVRSTHTTGSENTVEGTIQAVTNVTLLHAIQELSIAFKNLQDDVKTMKFNIQQIGLRR